MWSLHDIKTWLYCKNKFQYRISIYSNDMRQILVVSCIQKSLQFFEDFLLNETRHFLLTICPISSGLINKSLMYNKYPSINAKYPSDNASRLIYRMTRIVILWAQKGKRLLSLQRKYCKNNIYTLVRRKEKKSYKLSPYFPFFSQHRMIEPQVGHCRPYSPFENAAIQKNRISRAIFFLHLWAFREEGELDNICFMVCTDFSISNGYCYAHKIST